MASDARAALANATRVLIEDGKIPGVAVAVVKGAAVKHIEVAGMRRVETNDPVQLDSVFQIASVSKTITGICAMQLVEKGLLELDRDVNAILEPFAGFIVRNPNHPDASITLRMLLGHCSSIRDSEVYNDLYTGGDSMWTLRDFLREYFSTDGCFYDEAENYMSDVYAEEEGDTFMGSAPGQSYNYSNVGAGLVGLLVEAASGKTFDEYAKEHVFDPLGMTSSSFTWAGLDKLGVSQDRFARPYTWHGKPAKGYYKPHGCYGFPTVSDGGLRTTITDLAAFLIAIANGGTHPGLGVQVLSKERLGEMHVPNFPAATKEYGLMWSLENGEANHNEDAPFTNIGLGVGSRLNVRRQIGHGGGDPGIGTGMYFSPDSGAGVIILKNGDLGRDTDDLHDVSEAAEKALWEAAWALADTF